MSSRPRVIRKVTKMGRDGRPKVVRDRRERLTMEKVKAQADRQCAAGADCRNRTDGVIQKDWEYARVTYAPGSVAPAYRTYPVSMDYHFSCVPIKAFPMTRFFIHNQRLWPIVRDSRMRV